MQAAGLQVAGLQAGSHPTIPKAMFQIAQAKPSEIPQVRALFQEYASSLDFDLSFQGFEQELATLPGEYVSLLLAYENGEVAGCVALRRFDETTAEMKRLYVKPAFQGKGLGKRFVDEICKIASGLGHKKIRLDTVPSMEAAISLYRAMGFEEIAPYRENPIAGATYFEKDLSEP